MGRKKNTRVCPVEKAGGLDNPLRKFIQNPRKIIKPYIKENMTILDVGCGPGFFSIEMAKMIGDSGKIIAADLQEGMLEIIRKKIKGTALENKITLHKCQEESIDVKEKVDFVNAFYVVHEVPDQEKLFMELNSILKPGGKILVAEPRVHVTRKSIQKMINIANKHGLEVIAKPKIFFSKALVLTNKK